MKKETSKILTTFFASIILASLMISLVSATWIDITYTPPEGAGKVATTGPDADSWYGKMINWFGLGETWALVIASIMVVLILIVGIYDILYSFSAFKQPWVMFIIALGVGIITGLSGAVRAIAIVIFGFTGALGAIGIALGILIPIVIFVLVNIAFFKLSKKMHAANTATEITAAGTELGATMKAIGTVGRGMKEGGENAEK